MTPREEAELEAKITYEAFIKWVKVTFYWIMAMLVVLVLIMVQVSKKEGSPFASRAQHKLEVGWVVVSGLVQVCLEVYKH